MHVSTTTRRSGDREYTATLLRRSYREDGKVKKETLANLSHLPPEAIDAIRRVLAGETLVNAQDAFEIERSLPAGHVNAALAMARRLELGKVLDRSRVPGAGSVPGDDPRQGDLPGIEARDGPHARAVDARQRTGREGADEDELYARDGLAAPSARTGSRTGSPRAICVMGRWCSTTCPRAISKGGRVRWRSWGTRAMASAACRRSSTACCVTTMGAGRGRGVQRRAARRQDVALADREAQGPLRSLADRRRRGSRDGHEGEHRDPRRGWRGGLDHRAESPDDQETRPQQACFSRRCLMSRTSGRSPTSPSSRVSG